MSNDSAVQEKMYLRHKLAEVRTIIKLLMIINGSIAQGSILTPATTEQKWMS